MFARAGAEHLAGVRVNDEGPGGLRAAINANEKFAHGPNYLTTKRAKDTKKDARNKRASCAGINPSGLLFLSHVRRAR
jgi:hypothetical protein